MFITSWFRRPAEPRAHAALRPLFLSLALLLACGDSPSPTLGETGRRKDAGGDDDVDASPGGPECAAGDTKSCPCQDGKEGERRCSDGFFGLCKGCTIPAETSSKCESGVYKGVMEGVYTGGIPGITAFYPYKLSAASELTLNQSAGEFATIGDGCLRFVSGDGGVVDSGAGWVTGEVDCTTGELAGVLRAYYKMTDLLYGEYKVFFKGKYSGTFNPSTKSFENGKWTGAEPRGALSSAGGEGTWTGVLSEDLDPSSGSLEGCLGEAFPEEKFK